jgi:hypothetical protein
VQLTSSIRVETRYRNGNIKLNRSNRTKEIKIFSGSDFFVEFEYAQPEEGHLVKYQVTREREDSNEYKLTLTIPNQVSHSFSVDVFLSHPYAKKKQVFHVQFAADEFEPLADTAATQQQDILRSARYAAQPKYTAQDEEDERPPSSGGFFGWLFGGPAQPEQAKDQPVKKAPKQHKFLSYFIFTVFLVGAIFFILSFVCKVNVAVSTMLTF